MNPHDTPEAVERHAEHVASCDLPGTATMLRRLHQRAVDAERELIEQARAGNALFRRFQAERDEARASLATTRADALREAAKTVRIVAEQHRGVSEAQCTVCSNAILALINQPTTTTGET